MPGEIKTGRDSLLSDDETIPSNLKEVRLEALRRKYGPTWNHEEALWRRIQWLLSSDAYDDHRAEALRRHRQGAGIEEASQVLRSFARRETQTLAALDRLTQERQKNRPESDGA